MKYILLKLINGEIVKISTSEVVYVCMAEENDNHELLVTRTIDMPELLKTTER